MIRTRAALLSWLLVLPLVWEATAAAQEQQVESVRVEGTKRVEADVIRNAIETKAGAALNMPRLRKDLQRVWALGFFSDAQIGIDDTNPDAPIVVVSVVEKPAVRSTKIQGNDELSDDDLKEAVEIKPYSILDQAAIQRAVKKIEEKYVEKGYLLAEVTSEVRPVDGNQNEVDVVFTIEENAKVQIARINFVGNERLSDKELKAVMQTSEGGFLSFLSGAGTFREEVFQNDLEALRALYNDNGFIEAKIGQPSVALSADKKRLYLTIPITEGEQYRLGEIAFAGDLLVSADELRKRTVSKTGEIFSRSRLQRDLQAISEVYLDKGYAYANVMPRAEPDPEERTIDITFVIEKGEKVTIERIEIVGNYKTRDKVIRRELRIYEGDLFSGSGLRISRQRVMALGFFESVDLNMKKGSRDDRVVITVTVKERATNTFQIAFGFSTFENFLFTAQFSQNNFFGWGQSASLSAQLSSLRRLFQLQFVDPYFLDTDWIFSFSLFNQEYDYWGFLRKSSGGDITWGYHLTEDLMVHLGYGLEFVEVEPGGTGANILLENRFRNGRSSSLKLTTNYDKRDNRLFPTSGNYQSLSVETSRSWLGATYIYNRYIGNSRWYQPLPFGFVAKAQGTVGFIDGENLPISELFFIGGINSVRGYQLRSIAPSIGVASSSDPSAPLFDFLVGGNKELIFNFELEFPIFDKAGIRGVAFYDMGNVYAEDQNFFAGTSKTPLGMLHSVGGGVRWFSPIGPLRFELGFPLTRREGDRASLFEFTIGNFF